jgi:hypothetical protein
MVTWTFLKAGYRTVVQNFQRRQTGYSSVFKGELYAIDPDYVLVKFMGA